MRSNLNAFSVLAFCVCSFVNGLWGQNVGIGTLTPNASAKLELSDANRGLLIPRVALVATNNGTTPVNAPATSLLVYNTNAAVTGGSGVGFYYWDGTQWVKLVPSNSITNDWAILGNAGTNPTTNFLGTTDNQALVFRTNNLENARISTNGNVSIGTTTSTAGRLINVIPLTETATATGIYNENNTAATGATYGIRNYNYSATASTKYGFYNYNSIDGIGTKYGIFSQTYVDATAAGTSYGTRSILDGNGSGTMIGIYSDMDQAGTGVSYGFYADVDLPATNITESYGSYTNMDYSSGIRYGNYNDMSTNATYDGDIYGNYNRVFGTGDGMNYGVYNDFEVTGTGGKYGVYNDFADIQGTKAGVYTTIPAGVSTGVSYGVYTTNYNQSANTQYGVYNVIDGFNGPARGFMSYLYPSATQSGTLYGVYSYIDDIGTGNRYGGYFNSVGATSYAVYAVNTNGTGRAGYFNGAVQTLTAGRTYAMFSDYNNDVVRFGSSGGSLTGNGATVAGTIVDYVADFDKNTIDGTAIGIGSVEYLLDGNARTTINNEFDPSLHIVYDLGRNTTESWDDVFADDFWNVSDIREKENIREMSYGLNEVMQMRTIAYTRKDDPFQDPKIGVVAQEIKALVPEAVKDHDNKRDENKPGEWTRVEFDRLGVSYNNLVPVLIKAVQEQQAQIESLKKEVETLKGR